MNLNNNHLHLGGRVRALASCYSNGLNSPPSQITSPSQIPLPKYTSTFKFPSDAPDIKSPTQQPEQNGNDNRWKTRFEDAEKKRKTLLSENQKSARDYANLERRYKEINNDLNMKQRLLEDKTKELNKLRQASEGLYKEYEKLKNRYDVETTAMHSAMKTASQWYTQNRELKRKSAVLVQKFLEVSPAGVQELGDENDGSSNKEDDELEGLRNTVKQLSEEVAKLQTELKTARLQEFEAQEQVVNLTTQLDEEVTHKNRIQSELSELRAMKENMGHVSKLVAVEMASLREQCVQEREVALRMKSEANAAQKERNVLAHQSALLLSEVIGDDKMVRVLQEVETLKRQLEEQQQKHAFEMQEMQDKIDQLESDSQFEVLEEKLKLCESELTCTLQRAERAENNVSQLSNKLSHMEEELNRLKCPPPPPPPPLPPPPPPLANGNIGLPKRTPNPPSLPSVEIDKISDNPVLEMANMLGISRKASNMPPPQSGAIDDIINEIKGGRFTLKTPEKPQSRKEEQTPAAVQEMLNVLGTLKRRQRVAVQQSTSNHKLADVAL